MHQDQRTDTACSNQPCRDDGLAEGRSRRQNPGLVPHQFIDGPLLPRPQFTSKSHVQRCSRDTFVFDVYGNLQVTQQRLNIVKAAAWQTDMLRMFFRAGYDPRLIVCRQPHCLSLIELRVLKRRRADQAIPQFRRK